MRRTAPVLGPGDRHRSLAALGEGERVVSVVRRLGEAGEPGDTHRLLGAVSRLPDRQVGEGLPHLGEDGPLRLDPALPPRVAAALREDPVGDHPVDAVAVERQRRQRSARLGDDHGLRRQHQPDGGVLLGQDLLDLLEVGVQALDGVEHRLLGHRHPGRPAEHRSQRLHHPALHAEDASHVPAERLGQRQQPQRLGRRRAVDDHDVPLAADHVVAQLEERQHLLGARDDGQLLGGDRVDASGVEHRHQVALDLPPGPLEPSLGVDLVHPQVRGDLGRLAADLLTEGVAQGVRGVGGEHQRAVAGTGGERGRAGSAGGLADPALAGEQDDANGHGLSHTSRLSGATRRASSGPSERCR